MILVTGASGTVGTELVRLLAQRGASVRVLTRTTPHPRGMPPNVEAVSGDLTRPETLTAAMAGVTRLYLLTPAAPTRAHLHMQSTALRAAIAADVEHIVAQSVLFAAPAAPVEVMRSHAQCEEMLRTCGLGWTILRPNSFMQNLLVFAPAIRATGTLAVAGTGVRLSLVDARDVAEVAATVLTGTGHEGRTYQLTGPCALGFVELAEHLANATDTAVRYLPVAPEQTAAGMRATGAADFAIDTALAHLEYWRTGVGADVTLVAQRLLGRPQRTFATFAVDYSAAFTGTPAQRTSGPAGSPW